LQNDIIPVGKSGHTATLYEDSMGARMFVFGGHNAYRGVESYGYSGWKDDEKTFFLSLNPKQPDQQLDQQLDQLPHQQQVPDQLPHLL